MLKYITAAKKYKKVDIMTGMVLAYSWLKFVDIYLFADPSGRAV